VPTWGRACFLAGRANPPYLWSLRKKSSCFSAWLKTPLKGLADSDLAEEQSVLSLKTTDCSAGLEALGTRNNPTLLESRLSGVGRLGGRRLLHTGRPSPPHITLGTFLRLSTNASITSACHVWRMAVDCGGSWEKAAEWVTELNTEESCLQSRALPMISTSLFSRGSST